MSRSSRWQIAFVLLVFTVWGVARHLHNHGEDLASSYIGCRLLAAGQGEHLYSHSSVNFSRVGDPAWDSMAVQTGFSPLGLLHPYVQTPLWAYSLEPVCTRMDFRSFCDAYIVVFMLSLSGTIWLVARYWTPALLHPVWIAVIYAGLYLSEPFKYAIFLAQTHILYLLMTVLALILAQRKWPVTAGILLALAAAVKITPGFLLLYWLVTRRYKAALSFVSTFAALTMLTVVLLGTGLTRNYFHSLSQNANVLLLAFNNQSLAGWWGGLWVSRAELKNWAIHPMPPVLKVVSAFVTFATSIWGGFLDRGEEREVMATTPYGAVFAIVGATVFAPIAWTHYYVLLVIPVMLFLSAWKLGKSPLWVACTLVVLVLNLYPVSFGSVHLYDTRFTIARSQFYAGLLAMGGLAVLAYRRRHSGTLLDAPLRDAAMVESGQ